MTIIILKMGVRHKHAFSDAQADVFAFRRRTHGRGDELARAHRKSCGSTAVPPYHRRHAEDPRHSGSQAAEDCGRRPATAVGWRQHGLYLHRPQGGITSPHAILFDLGNKGIYHDGWAAGALPIVMPWMFGKDAATPGQVEGRTWQLFNVAKDFSESTDLASRYPARLQEMNKLFFAEVARNHTLPIHRYEGSLGRPSYNGEEKHFHFDGPVSRIPGNEAPRLAGRSFDLSADKAVPGSSVEGTIFAMGGYANGMSLYLDKGVPVLEYNLANLQRTKIAAPDLGACAHMIGIKFDRAGGAEPPATVTLSIDGRAVVSGRVLRTLDFGFTLNESFDLGRDSGTAVADYAVFYIFGGTPNGFDITLR